MTTLIAVVLVAALAVAIYFSARSRAQRQRDLGFVESVWKSLDTANKESAEIKGTRDLAAWVYARRVHSEPGAWASRLSFTDTERIVVRCTDDLYTKGRVNIDDDGNYKAVDPRERKFARPAAA